MLLSYQSQVNVDKESIATNAQLSSMKFLKIVAKQPEDQSRASYFALLTRKIKKNKTLFIDQSAFSNFAFDVIRTLIKYVPSPKRYVHVVST